MREYNGELREFPDKSSNFGLLYGRVYGPLPLECSFLRLLVFQDVFVCKKALNCGWHSAILQAPCTVQIKMNQMAANDIGGEAMGAKRDAT